MTTAWLDLRDAALGATRRGWPVTPGTFLGTDRRWHGRADAQALCPVEDTWRDTPVTDPAQAWKIWTHEPYGVLLVCGREMTVLELPVTLIGLLTPTELVFPVVVTGSQRLLVITATDSDTLLPQLTEAGVRLRGAGAWVALAPHHHRSRALPAVVHQPHQGPDAAAPGDVDAAASPRRAARHQGGAMMSANAPPRHRAPSRWLRWAGGGEGQMVTVKQLRKRNRDLLSWPLRDWPPRELLFQHRPTHVVKPRRITVILRPRAAQD